ncbi:MAG TPA: alpha-L-arabinofuranosidase C-terminal domain-containing protein [Verrucomicrobiae bacterium]|nr:alpha-L-arabinofuranosidase C-terminal domain-containing protein [Verrucomicrobiae bacterium]
MRKFWGFFGIVWLISASAAYGQATITVLADQPGVSISSNLFGIFFEEISSAGDGGIYAELVRNRSFEDSTNSIPFWTLVTNGAATGQMTLDASLALSPTNLHALKLTMSSGAGAIGAVNAGYWGIPLTAGATYNLGFYARAPAGFTGPLTAVLESTTGTIYAEMSVNGLNTNWQHFELGLVPSQTDPASQLLLEIEQPATVYLDFVSLFPAQTFNNRTNGLRPDLADMLVNLKPSFVRFPGGSWVDGLSIADAYHWDVTVGDPANRVPRTNLWGYMVDNGLGYHEYLQMCEDIGAVPLFAVNCGMDVNQNAVPTNQLAPWVREAVDAISYANDATNTPWGAQRAANGHPAPFNLRYMEIGNENNGPSYNANYGLFYTAIKSNYPYMHLIANSQGTIPTSAPVEIVDEHYYSSQAAFNSYATKYDSYSRAGPKVFVGEYAVTSGGGNGNIAGALGEAAFMTGMERNSDIVEFASYAPLFANLNNKDWNPDLIYFNGTQVYGTPSYYVQQMFSLNRGDYVLPSVVAYTNTNGNTIYHGAIGLGSWNTSVQYTNVLVTSNGVTLYQSDFADNGAAGWRVFNGTWTVVNGLYQQTAITTDCYSTSGNTNWASYTISLQARKVTGDEGFLILFNWMDDNNWTWWNIAGWNNTLDGIEQMSAGVKSLISPQISESVNANQWYNIQIVLTGPRIQCYLNGALIHDISYDAGILTASTSYSESTGQIIVKAVNSSTTPLPTTIQVNGLDSVSPGATMIQLASTNPAAENSLSAPTNVFPVTNAISGASANFTLTLPANSLSILRLTPNGIHTFTNLQFQLNSPLTTGQTEASLLSGWESGQAGPINLSSNTNHAITYSSTDTNVAVVDESGNVTGEGPGAASIIATYGSLGLSATQSVQVVGVPNTLVHRYSFSDAPGSSYVVDSLGGFAWNGTLPNGGVFAGGQLTLASSNRQYVLLPAGILSNYTAVTIEVWATFPGQLPVNCFFYGFGDTDSGGVGEDYIFCAPQGGRIAITAADPGYTGEQNAAGAGDLSFQTNLHFVAIYNPPAGYLALYTNGVLAALDSAVTIPLSSVSPLLNYIGRSLYNADPYPDIILDEFRIYNGALSPTEIAATQAIGPNSLLSVVGPALVAIISGANITFSWPLASAGFTLQSAPTLSPTLWAGGLPSPQIIAGQWHLTVPLSASTQYYRLVR